MRKHIAGSTLDGKKRPVRWLMTLMMIQVVGLLSGAAQADVLWTPSVEIGGMYSDNILFSHTDPVDDYIYTIEPALQLDYLQELTEIHTQGSVLVRRYQDNDDLDDENYNFDFNGEIKPTERVGVIGSYELIKDTTLDSELLETGSVFIREDRLSQEGRLVPYFNLTERMRIDLGGRYRAVDYDSDTEVDYSVWDVFLPLRWRLVTQIDSIYISPGYSYRDSDANSSESYKLKLGWDHDSTERFNFKFAVGARYTEHEQSDTGETDEKWNGLADLRLEYKYETGKLNTEFQHDLRTAADGDQVNLTKVLASLLWNFTERAGIRLYGRYYYTITEGRTVKEKREFYLVGSRLFYHLTRNHRIFIAYDYAQDNQKDLAVEPRVDRQRIWAGVSLNFPMT
jgi:hypothetical protein